MENNPTEQTSQPVQPVTQTLVQAPAPIDSEKQNFLSSKWLKIGIGILIIIAILGGTFVLGGKIMNKSAIPTPTPETMKPTPTPINQTVNWKTYNEPNGLYSFKYPKDWTSLETATEITLYPSGYAFKAPGEPDPANPYLRFDVYPQVIGRGVNPVKTETVAISGKEVKRFYESLTKGVIETIPAPNGQGVAINFQLPQDAAKSPEIASTFNQILSTFKFTNSSDETANWKTHNSSIVSFKYPTNYRVEEREKNYFVVVEDKATVAPTEGIAIDARLSGAFSEYNSAINVLKDNLGEIREETILGGVKISGVIRSGSGPGIPSLHFILKYGKGAIVTSYTQSNPDTVLFDNFISTLKFTQ